MFVTGNPHKFAEAQEILKPWKIRLAHRKESYPEIRSENVEEVALEGAKLVFQKIGKPLIVEDSGLFIPALNDFPGAYSAWARKKIGNTGILKLLGGETRREACFRSCIAYADSEITKTFCGTVCGKIPEREAGSKGFGYDPIFIPEGESQTFAENETLKNRISHRSNAFTDFAKWYSTYTDTG